MYSGACPGGAGPLDTHLYFANFLVENIIFSATFGAGPPPPREKLKSQKKKRLSDFGPPPLRIPGHAPGTHVLLLYILKSAHL